MLVLLTEKREKWKQNSEANIKNIGKQCQLLFLDLLGQRCYHLTKNYESATQTNCCVAHSGIVSGDCSLWFCFYDAYSGRTYERGVPVFRYGGLVVPAKYTSGRSSPYFRI